MFTIMFKIKMYKSIDFNLTNIFPIIVISFMLFRREIKVKEV